MVRSILLRGFDQDMANKIGDYMKSRKVHFLNQMIPHKFSKNEHGKIVVEYKCLKDKSLSKEEFDTVILATGRHASTARLGLDKIGVKVSKSKKVIVDNSETSSVDNIYSIGDCAEGRPELTPPAIQVINGNIKFIIIKHNITYFNN